MKQNNLPNIASRIFGVPLMIQQQKLDTIIHVLSPHLTDGGFIANTDSVREKQSFQVTTEGIAVIPVIGTLVQRTSGLNALSGLTSYQKLEGQIEAALADGGIQGILLDIDSPGGEVAGVFDLADMIFQAREEKPIWAFANELAASAAYAIASSADKVFLTRTSFLGSVGVVTAHVDQSEFDKKEGFKVTYIHAGSHKVDANPHEPLKDDVRASIQKKIDDIHGIFIGAVARNRNISAKTVLDTGARVFMGEDALSVNLADGVVTFKEMYSAFVESLSSPTSSINLSTKENNLMNPQTHEEELSISEQATEAQNTEKDSEDDGGNTPSAAPSVPTEPTEGQVAAIIGAVTAERERVLTLLSTAGKLGVPKAQAEELIKTGITAEAGKDKLIDYKAAHDPAGDISGVRNQDYDGAGIDANAPIEERAEAEWRASPDIRTEFNNNKEAYVEFKRNEEAGNVKILKNG